jgi:hypothetical protein
MMLVEQRQTNNSIAFDVKIGNNKNTTHTPEIKKKLEASASKAAPSITLEQISEKLMRAELKRKESLNLPNTQEKQEKRRNNIEERRSQERAQLDQMKVKIEKDLIHAEEKRMSRQEEQQKKLRNHINKVEEVRREQAVKRQTSCEHLRSELEQKLGHATQKREEQLEHKKTIAQKSAEKKHNIN